jgi:hypothetical protein
LRAYDLERGRHRMADKIVVARKWYQGDHYAICLAKKKLAIAARAVAISRMALERIVVRRRQAPPSPTLLC